MLGIYPLIQIETQEERCRRVYPKVTTPRALLGMEEEIKVKKVVREDSHLIHNEESMPRNV